MQYTPTKKERRALRRAAKAEARAQQTNTGHWRRGFNWLFGVVIAGLAIWGLVVLVQSTQRPAEIISDKLAIAADDWHKGPAEAKATLVEYGDFQCPACAAYHDLVDQLILELGDQMRFVYRHFPLTSIHANAQGAALASEAAGAQGKFWEMYDLLYTKQGEWSDLADPMPKFKEFATALELDLTKFEADAKASASTDKVARQVMSANQLRVDSTPTFYLNGARVSPRNYEEFKGLITAVIDEAPAE